MFQNDFRFLEITKESAKKQQRYQMCTAREPQNDNIS